MREFACTKEASDTVFAARQGMHRILHGMDDRMIVVIGPCSIHDTRAAIEYAKRLKPVRDRLSADLEIVMRVYFEKPRTTVGWKGLINDPDLDGSFDINKGVRVARELLLDINSMGLPAGCEFLDMITPQYIADLVSWGAIGARTTESQVHRELASGLSCPVGFKNGTDGNVKIAVHVILRGGKTPYYDAASIEAACQDMSKAGLAQRIMIDASHANSSKKPENQPLVIEDVARQMEAGDSRLVGVMVESHLLGGRQDMVPGTPLVYGQSITDGCIDWDASVAVLERLAHAVRERRRVALTSGK
jgi:3-deoxy-7-phosphoheptulonate synthase